MFVYGIGPAETGPTKIGYTDNLRQRLATLQTASHERLHLHFSVMVGKAAPLVERKAHRMLEHLRKEGGTEWYDVSPDAAEIVVKAAAKAAPLFQEPSWTLLQADIRASRWYNDEIEAKWILEDNPARLLLPPDWDEEHFPGVLQMAVDHLRLRPKRFSFADYILTYDLGILMRRAAGGRLPVEERFWPYNALAKEADTSGTLPLLWLEWCHGRRLSSSECAELARVWNEFAAKHMTLKLTERGIDDHVEGVHVCALTRDRPHGDRDCVIFSHEDFRAVIIPQKEIELCKGFLDLQGLGSIPVTGFVTPHTPADLMQRPFLPWLAGWKKRLERSFNKFVSNPHKRFPTRREVDGSRPSDSVHFTTLTIEDDGTINDFYRLAGTPFPRF
jgi:hypothetical protein